MDIFTMDHFKRLLERDTGYHVSLFMPTERLGTEEGPDPIKFKNLMGEVRSRLESFGMRTPEIKAFLEEAEATTSDAMFWRYQSEGLAMFISENVFEYFRLPMAFREQVMVGERFHTRPLLPLLEGDGRYYVLTLSQNQIRLFQCSKFSINEIKDLEGIPESLAEALAYDDPEQQLQLRFGGPGMGGHAAAIFHGHGGKKEDAKVDILRFFQQVDRGLQALLKDDGTPLVLAGVDYLLPIFRQASNYQALMEEGIMGNPDHLRPEQFHEAAWEIVKPQFLKEREQFLRRYRQQAGTGLTSSDLREILPAAHHGRVEYLGLARGAYIWGEYDPERDQIDVHEDEESGEDLLNLAAIQTLKNGGTAYAIDQEQIPEQRMAIAVFRY